MASPTGRPIRAEVLDLAEVWIRRVGANGFSYGDLAGELGIKAPSIHHHFRTKDDLVAEVAGRYRERFTVRVADIDDVSTVDRLSAYAALFADAAREDMMCLCGAVAAEWTSVGDRTRAAVQGFFDDQLDWLAATIGAGVAAGELRSGLDVSATSEALLAALEGAMVMTRAGSVSTLPADVASTIVAGIVAPG